MVSKPTTQRHAVFLAKPRGGVGSEWSPSQKTGAKTRGIVIAGLQNHPPSKTVRNQKNPPPGLLVFSSSCRASQHSSPVLIFMTSTSAPYPVPDNGVYDKGQDEAEYYKGYVFYALLRLRKQLFRLFRRKPVGKEFTPEGCV